MKNLALSTVLLVTLAAAGARADGPRSDGAAPTDTVSDINFPPPPPEQSPVDDEMLRQQQALQQFYLDLRAINCPEMLAEAGQLRTQVEGLVAQRTGLYTDLNAISLRQRQLLGNALSVLQQAQTLISSHGDPAAIQQLLTQIRSIYADVDRLNRDAAPKRAQIAALNTQIDTLNRRALALLDACRAEESAPPAAATPTPSATDDPPGPPPNDAAPSGATSPFPAYGE